MKIFALIALMFILFPTACCGEDAHANEEHTVTSAVEQLSPGLRSLLSQEMQALQGGMMSIIPAYVSGNWGEIATTAKKMKDSYILEQNLTPSQIEELESVLPDEFFEKDQRFHYLAGMLEHAAKSKKPELINFYFSEMNESCVGCHASFALHKFRDLAPKNKSGHSH